jgi:hypothetical protein
MTPRELYELADRLQRHHHALAFDPADLDLGPIRDDVRKAGSCVRDLARFVTYAGEVVAR